MSPLDVNTGDISADLGTELSSTLGALGGSKNFNFSAPIVNKNNIGLYVVGGVVVVSALYFFMGRK